MNGLRSKGIYLVMSVCNKPLLEDSFNRWYDNEHLPEILAHDIFHQAWRYKAVTADLIKYMTIYETNAPDLQAASEKLEQIRLEWQENGSYHPGLEIVARSFMRTLDPGLFILATPLPTNVSGLVIDGSDITSSGNETDFNRWYDKVHIPDIAEADIFSAIHRFYALKKTPDQPYFINFLETDIEDLGNVFEKLKPYSSSWRERGRRYPHRSLIWRGVYKLIAARSSSATSTMQMK